MPPRVLHEIESHLRSKIDQAQLLGNHYKKNIRNIEKSLPLLLQRLGEGGALPLFDFEEISPFCYEEMELIRHLSKGTAETFDLLGCYYSIQLVAMNLHLLEFMEKGQHVFESRTEFFKAMLLQAEGEFTRLYSALIQIFLEIFSRDEKDLPEYVICHVGARRDQDDIDVGIIHAPGGDLTAMNRVIGRLNQEMYRSATQMHFYLSEQSGAKWFTSTIADYERLMAVDLKNLVIITQLFGAVPIMGSMTIFEEFQKRVVMRYTYREGGDNLYYEGFMRGIVEEIRSLVLHRSRVGEIVPKVDALRLAKIIVSARRAALGIAGGKFWKAFEVLQEKDTYLNEEYQYLEEAIAFMETLRFLYQLIFIQEEGILFSDSYCRAALDRVASLMGYDGEDRDHPSTVLLRDYFRYSKEIKRLSLVFKEEFKRYVAFIRVFRGLAHLGTFRDLQQGTANMASDYIEVMDRFHHALPWGEFISFLEEEEDHRQRFCHDMFLLDHDDMRRTLDRYARSMVEEGEPLIRFLLCFFRGTDPDRSSRLEETLIEVFWQTLRRSSLQRENIFRFLLEEQTLCRHLVRNTPSEFSVDLLHEVRKSRGTFKARLMDRIFSHGFLFHYRSPLVKRQLERVVGRGLIREENVTDPLRLSSLSRNTLRQLSSQRDLQARFHALQDFYDIETLFFAFRSIRTRRFGRAGYMDRYVRRLIHLTLHEAGLESLAGNPEGLGFYATGGNARGDSCENDYDMFVLYDDSFIDVGRLNRAVERMHREMSRLGNMPHHRLAEQIGSFAVSLQKLAGYLEQGYADDFIERSELIGSRLVFGGRGLHQRFLESIIHEKIFDGKSAFIRSLITEFQDLHTGVSESTMLDLKQSRGGLFDITLVACMLKAHFEIYEPSDMLTLQILQKRDPRRSEDYKTLFRGRRFLTEVRGLLRLTGYNDVIDPSVDIRYPALLKGCAQPEQLVVRVMNNMRLVAGVSDRLMEDLLSKAHG
jgi:hypothetical protein